MFNFELMGLAGQNVIVIVGLILFVFLVFTRIFRYEKVVRDRMIAFVIFAFFTVFFWLSFEQGASSLVLFARDSVDRIMTGSAATAYNVINTLLTIVPLGIITYVLVLLWKRTYKKIPGSNIVLAICFAGLWIIVGWMLNRDFNTKSYEVSYTSYQGDPIMDEGTNKQKVNDKDELLFVHIPITTGTVVPEGKEIYTETVTIGEQLELLICSFP